MAVKSDGSVLAWGRNDLGQTTVPAAAQSGVIAIAAGAAHTVALKNDGSVLAWGWNVDGQTTVPIAAQSGVTAIAAGHYHTVALKTNGTVVAWGSNIAGQRTVPLAAQNGVAAISAGVYHTVALKDDRTVVAWGSNREGHTNAFSYFILYRGMDFANIYRPVDATLGPFVFQLSDPTLVASNASAFLPHSRCALRPAAGFGW